MLSPSLARAHRLQVEAANAFGEGLDEGELSQAAVGVSR